MRKNIGRNQKFTWIAALVAASAFGTVNASAETSSLTIGEEHSGNVLQLDVVGDGNVLQIEQAYAGSIAEQRSSNRVDISILGDRNGGAGSDFGPLTSPELMPGHIVQTGHGNAIEFDVLGSNNLFAFVQTGTSNMASGVMSGFENQATVQQTGQNNIAAFSQSGNGNIVNITQTSW